eukprot:6323381-Amphidinium_carterae.2
MVDSQASVPLSLAESESIRRTKPELILPSRWHIRRKTVETQEGTTKVLRALWILLGHLRMRVEIYGSAVGRHLVYDPCLCMLPPEDTQKATNTSSCFDAQHFMHDTSESLIPWYLMQLSLRAHTHTMTSDAATDNEIRAHEGLLILLVDDMLEGAWRT